MKYIDICLGKKQFAEIVKLKSINCILIFAVFMLWNSSAFGNAEKKLNFVIIYADDMGYGDLAIQNPKSKIATPNLDKLAKEGMRFTDGHSSSSICSPSRYALLTGRYHWRKSSTLSNDMFESRFAPDRLTLPEMMKKKGYKTACIGKWHLGFGWLENVKENYNKKIDKKAVLAEAIDWSKKAPDGPTAHGFDYYFGDGTPNFPPYAWVENDKMLAEPTIQISEHPDGDRFKPGPSVENWEFEKVMPTLTAKAVEWIGKQKGQNKPFFMYIPWTSPHTPVLPIDKFKGSSKAGEYGDYVTQSDWHAGEVLKALEKNGFSENTVVIFTADNGAAGQMQTRFVETGHNSSGELKGMKISIYEGGHRVPFIIKWPGVTSAGSVSHALISQIDIMATIAKAIGYDIEEGQAEDSLNLMPVISGKQNHLRKSLVINNKLWGMRYGDWVYLEDADKNRMKADYLKARGYTKETAKYVLYNIKKDVAQRHNVIDQHPEIRKKLQAMLAQAKKKEVGKWKTNLPGR